MSPALDVPSRQIGPHSGYASALLGPVILAGAGLGPVFAATLNTGTFGVPPGEAGVASGSIRTANQIGGSIGLALLNTIAAGATAGYLASRAHSRPAPQLAQLTAIHGYATVFWWCAGIFAVGVVVGALLRRGPLTRPVGTPIQERPRQADGVIVMRTMPGLPTTSTAASSSAATVPPKSKEHLE